MSSTRWPTFPEPTGDLASQLELLGALKMSMELITGQRGFDESYSVDKRFDTITKSVNGVSSTISEIRNIAINDSSALAERITLVEVEIDTARNGEPNLNARIVDVDTASVSRDGALASSVSIVQARVNDVSAGGYFKTQATVAGGGALASMEAQVYTNAGFGSTLSAGWKVSIVGGVSYFDMYTANWRLIDNVGVAKQVMSYSAGKFRFTGDVAIDGILVINGTVYTDTIAPAAVSQMAAVTTTGIPTIGLTLRAGATVLMIGSWTGDPAGVNLYPATASGGLTFYVNGVPVMARLCGFYQDVPTNPALTYRCPVPTTYQFVYTVPANGSYVFQMENQWNGSINAIGTNTLSILETTR